MDVLQYDFMQHAILAGLLASIICGIIGTLVVVNRIVFLSGGIAHAAYGGIGMALYLRWPYLAGAIGFAVCSGITMGLVALKVKHRADTIIGVVWAVGMAIGVVLVDLTPGYHADLLSYLFGSILTVSKLDLWVMAGASLVILLVVGFLYYDFMAMSYDDEFARIRGFPVSFLYCLLVVMIAVAVVLTMRVVGLILIIALLTIPPFIAERYARSLAGMMVMAICFSAVFVAVGLWVSYGLDITSGAAIILTAGAGFFISMLVDPLVHRKSGRKPVSE